ncbi:MAG: hydrogenase maturation protease [Trueperaceae bacterium]
MARPLLILGVGNVFYGDEGAGVHLIHYLRTKYRFPEGVDVVDGGTLGWQLLTLIADYPRVVFVDAVAAPVGKVYRFGPGEVPAEVGYGKLSSHEWEVPDLLTAMQLHGDVPEVSIVAIGVDPLEFSGEGIGVQLGPVVGPRMPALATVVLRELEAEGVVPEDVRPELTADTPFTAEAIVVGARAEFADVAEFAHA